MHRHDVSPYIGQIYHEISGQINVLMIWITWFWVSVLRGFAMRWLFRIILVGIAVTLFLPGNEPERAMVFQGLKSAVLKTMNYCDREPDFCDRSRAALQRVTQSARESIQDIASGSRQNDLHEDTQRRRDSHNTLGGGDYEPQWRLP